MTSVKLWQMTQSLFKILRGVERGLEQPRALPQEMRKREPSFSKRTMFLNDEGSVQDSASPVPSSSSVWSAPALHVDTQLGTHAAAAPLSSSGGLFDRINSIRMSPRVSFDDDESILSPDSRRASEFLRSLHHLRSVTESPGREVVNDDRLFNGRSGSNGNSYTGATPLPATLLTTSVSSLEKRPFLSGGSRLKAPIQRRSRSSRSSFADADGGDRES